MKKCWNQTFFFPLNILNLCVKNHIKNFMTIGTALPKNFNMYSFTKSKFADFGEFFCDNEEINFVNLNVEMFYGGFNEPDNRFIKSCALKLIQNIDLDLTIGTQKRDIIHMEDVTHLISALMNTNYIKGYRSLDVGSGINHSVREIIEFMKQEMNSCSRLNYGVIQSRVGEPSTVAKIDWYKDINYQMKYSYYEGLKNECKIIQNYYLNHLV